MDFTEDVDVSLYGAYCFALGFVMAGVLAWFLGWARGRPAPLEPVDDRWED